MPRTQTATLLPSGAARIGMVELDCALEETHTWASQVTRVPVESGAIRSQHITKLPYILQITGVIADIPVDPHRQQVQVAFNLAQSRVKGYEATIPGIAAARNQVWSRFQNIQNQAINFGGAFNPAQAVGIATATRALAGPPQEYSANDKFKVALARMLNLRDSDTPFDYISPLGVVENLVFENLEVPVDQTTDFLFRARLVEFRETGITRSNSLAISQEDASSDAANIGSRTTIEAEFEALLAS